MNRRKILSHPLPAIALLAALLFGASPTWACGAWSPVPSPNPSVAASSFLTAVTARSATDVWAVGDSFNLASYTFQALIEHYNGARWSIVPGPHVGTNNALAGVTASSATDVWAVGDYCCSSTKSDQTLIEHYNGTSWSVVSSPNVGHGGNVLTGVTAASPSDVWAVGNDESGILIEHFDGTRWSVVPNPNPSPNMGTLTGVTAISASDIWAVGVYCCSSAGIYQTLVEHFDGSRWSIIPSPNVGTYSQGLRGVGAAAAADVWAVGSYGTPQAPARR